MRRLWKLIKCTITDFFADDSMTLAAALAFYTILSLAPLAVLLVVAAGFIGQDTVDRIVEQAEQMMGPNASGAIKTVIASAQQNKSTGTISAIISLALILFSALGAFVQLQYSMNRIWGLQASGKSAAWVWIRNRLISLLLIFVIAVLLLAAVVASSVITAALPRFTWANPVVSFVIAVIMFTILFKFLPDARIAWRDVLVGAVLTAILFAVGIWLIGLYLGRSSAGSPYGAAGSLVVFLIWVYYAALIMFLGAELTQAYSYVYGDRIEPDEYSQQIDKHGQKKPEEPDPEK